MSRMDGCVRCGESEDSAISPGGFGFWQKVWQQGMLGLSQHKLGV
jgi:hypothetical protein